MDVTEKDIKEFQDLYKSKFGKDIDSKSAREKLVLLVRQMEIVHQPVTRKDIKELARRDAMQADAEALAELIYDIYQESKQG